MNNKTSAKKITSIGRKKLKKGTYYKFVVVATAADRSSGGKAVTKALATSVSIHCMTLGARGKGDYKKVLLKSKSKVLLNKGKKSKILAMQKAAKGIRVSQHRKISYVSTDPGIATVSKKGIITARKKGRAIIYVYSQNGVFKTVKVTVR